MTTAEAVAENRARHSETPGLSKGHAAPPVPDTLADTGLSESQIADLLLKVLYQNGALRGDALAKAVALPFHIIDDPLMQAQQRHLVEVLQALGHGRSGYTFSLTQEGQQRGRTALEASRYAGAAPVPLEQFRHWVNEQAVRNNDVSHQQLGQALSDLVLPDGVAEALGPAVNSGASIFLHGAPGNGKTAIAERLGSLTSSTIYLPRAVMIHGHVMVLYDSIYHQAVEDEEPEEDTDSPLIRSVAQYDQRFVRVRRPTVFVGGELTMEQLDLQFDPYSKVYQAPFQLKAAGGVLLIDDFGRQRVRPEEILNRWIVPLEKGFDNLTLHSGIKFPIPFDCILIFATNLNPGDLVDEAFLRRIQYKVEVRSPTRAAFEEIFRMNCNQLNVGFDSQAVDLLFKEYYDGLQIPPRGCHPRDILQRIKAVADYEGREPTLEPAALRQAVHSYFLVMEEEYQAGVPSVTSHHGE
jgi:predicted ATPase with chaperone activity